MTQEDGRQRHMLHHGTRNRMPKEAGCRTYIELRSNHRDIPRRWRLGWVALEGLCQWRCSSLETNRHMTPQLRSCHGAETHQHQQPTWTFEESIEDSDIDDIAGHPNQQKRPTHKNPEHIDVAKAGIASRADLTQTRIHSLHQTGWTFLEKVGGQEVQGRGHSSNSCFTGFGEHKLRCYDGAFVPASADSSVLFFDFYTERHARPPSQEAPSLVCSTSI